jgi:magnesium transporter
VSVFVYRDGRTERAPAVDASWLLPASGAVVWVDLVAPTPAEASVLRDVFHFHELAVEDALSESETPKIEAYEGYLYLILHGIDVQASAHGIKTHDTDFFIGSNFLVTIQDGFSRTIAGLHDLCLRNDRILGEGAAALLHRIVDGMVDHYRPETDTLQDRVDGLEDRVFEAPDRETVRHILDLKREIALLRRVLIPQRDVVGRLARREFALVDVEMAYRFRDVYDHLVRLTDETMMSQDRITSILEAHVSNVSNRLNEVMKVLTVIATIFMPLTVMTGMFGMNVEFPQFMGGPRAQFWWIVGAMATISGSMLWWFRRRDWI